MSSNTFSPLYKSIENKEHLLHYRAHVADILKILGMNNIKESTLNEYCAKFLQAKDWNTAISNIRTEEALEPTGSKMMVTGLYEMLKDTDLSTGTIFKADLNSNSGSPVRFLSVAQSEDAAVKKMMHFANMWSLDESQLRSSLEKLDVQKELSIVEQQLIKDAQIHDLLEVMGCHCTHSDEEVSDYHFDTKVADLDDGEFRDISFCITYNKLENKFSICSFANDGEGGYDDHTINLDDSFNVINNFENSELVYSYSDLEKFGIAENITRMMRSAALIADNPIQNK